MILIEANASVSSEMPLAQLAGPVIIGYMLHWGLFGTLTIQLYLYYRAFPEDRTAIKVLVYSAYMLEVVQTVLLTRDAFKNFATGFGDTATLRGVHWDWLTIPVMSGIVAFIGQSFYAYRIFSLSKSYWIPGLIVVMSLTSSISAMIIGSYQHTVGVVPPPHTKENSVASAIWLGGAALTDFIIALSFTYYLLKYDTGFRRTHALVVRLIRLTIETGSITAAIALINLALFFTFPDRPYFFTVGVLLPKLYANTMLAVLNSRFVIVGGRGYTDTATHQSLTFRDGEITGAGDGVTMTTNSRPPVVTITREIFSDRELSEIIEMKDITSGSQDSHIAMSVEK
ncbi:hypothetical protein FB45DRAFT_796255 [Roridomyces roridus]|uniref:DUF6534 domain-containing protein n=1 Tax=Roridomyces roridus TaxID=1738132 RepID=A0AAD7FL73_9AGAR|nr:hypothetical protein FB45DRAFT_796255 [Roridomyces roridus]